MGENGQETYVCEWWLHPGGSTLHHALGNIRLQEMALHLVNKMLESELVPLEDLWHSVLFPTPSSPW